MRLVLLFAGIIIFSSYIFFSLYSSSENVPYTMPSLNCDEKYIQKGNECYLDPAFIEKNTIIIYDGTFNNGEARKLTAPNSLVINLEENDTITWINESIFTVSVEDFTKELYGMDYAQNVIINKDQHTWKIDEINPQTQKSMQFNNTGIYHYRVDTTNNGDVGDIVVLSKETNSLPVAIKAKMAQSIIHVNIYSIPELISTGSGSGAGVSIGIDENELEKHNDAYSYYYEYFDNMIPFDVPMIIEFEAPVTLQ